MIFELNDRLFLPHLACDIRLQLSPGEVHVLVGENGLGKTTLLHRIGKSLAASSQAFVPQTSMGHFFDRQLKVLKHLFITSELEKFSEKKFNHLWNSFGLLEKENRKLSALSGGEAQALKLCLLLSKEADIYLLDEPSQSLDAQRKKILGRFLQELAQAGKKVLLVEHQREWLLSGWEVHELVSNLDCLKLERSWKI